MIVLLDCLYPFLNSKLKFNSIIELYRYDEIPREDDEHSQFKPQNRSNNEIRNTSHNTEPFLPDVNSKGTLD